MFSKVGGFGCTGVLDHSYLRDIPYPKVGCRPIELLIGQDCPEALTPIDFGSGRKRPFAIKPRLGWVVSGPIEKNLEHRQGFIPGGLMNENGPWISGVVEEIWVLV